MSVVTEPREKKAKKRSLPLWRDFNIGRMLIWITWGTLYFSVFVLPEYSSEFRESVYLLVRIGSIGIVLLVPMILMPYMGTKKVLGHFLKTMFYPVVVPFIIGSFLLEIRRVFKRITEHPLLGVVHYSVILLIVAYGLSVNDIYVWEFLTPFIGVLVVTNIIWATSWICRPLRFMAFINGWVKKNQIKIVENLAKNFLKTKKLEDSKSVIKLTDTLTKLFERLNSPFLVTVMFISVMVPVLLSNIFLFALALKGEFLKSRGAALSGELFTSENLSFIKLSISYFIGHELHGVSAQTVVIQNILLCDAMAGIYFLVGIFFAYSSFGLTRATDTIKSFQDLVAAMSDSLKIIAKDAGLEEFDNFEDKNVINAQLSVLVKKDGHQTEA